MQRGNAGACAMARGQGADFRSLILDFGFGFAYREPTRLKRPSSELLWGSAFNNAKINRLKMRRSGRAYYGKFVSKVRTDPEETLGAG